MDSHNTMLIAKRYEKKTKENITSITVPLYSYCVGTKHANVTSVLKNTEQIFTIILTDLL